MATSNSIMVSEKSKRQSAATNMKLSAALRGNNNAAGPHKMSVMGRNALKGLREQAAEMQSIFSSNINAGLKKAYEFSGKLADNGDSAVKNVATALKSAKASGADMLRSTGAKLPNAKTARATVKSLVSAAKVEGAALASSTKARINRLVDAATLVRGFDGKPTSMAKLKDKANESKREYNRLSAAREANSAAKNKAARDAYVKMRYDSLVAAPPGPSAIDKLTAVGEAAKAKIEDKIKAPLAAAVKKTSSYKESSATIAADKMRRRRNYTID